ncbi:MAG: PorV/PorQ family protein [Elusimicrobia bacterium]|nr:PorV/PorQ family protein [Elusimicrobiota bacterium]
MTGALLAVLLAAPARAGVSENGGTIAAPVLQIPVGARAASLGTAFTAVADDVSTIYYNPAGLTSVHHREATMMFLNGSELQTTNYFAGATPLPFSGLSGSGFATLGASLLASSNGNVDVTTLKADGSSAGTRTVDAGGDTVLTVGYAERIADTPFETKDTTLHFDHYFGASGKFVRSTLAEDYHAQTYAADIGYLGRAPELGVSLGASIVNLGGKLRYVETADPLPLAMRLGGAYQVAMPANHFLQWSLDGQYEYYEKLCFVNTGLEYTFFKSFATRLGYQVHKQLAGLTMGFGARWRNWAIDYAWAFNDSQGDAHRFSFTFRFGAVPVREREKARRPFIESVPEKDELPERGDEKPSTYDQPSRPRRSAPEPQGAPGWIY